MKALLLASVCLALASSAALACRGTVEYPQTAAQLAQAQMPAPEKEDLTARLQAGEAIHRRGHDMDSRDLRQESLRILDEIKAQIAK